MTAPPNVDTNFTPTDRGDSAREYLESQGLVAVSPPIHSSDDGKDEFLYYLSRRLGLVPASHPSDALTTGSYFHLAAQHYDKNDAGRSQVLKETLALRHQEIRSVASAFHLSDEDRARLIDHENKHGQTGFAIFSAIADLELDVGGTTVTQFLENPATIELGRELRVQVATEWGPAVAIYDRLLYHPKQNTIWIDDYKTHDGEPLDRAQICPLEMQTWLYLYIAKTLLQQGWFRDNFNIPIDAVVGGMRHIIVRKPSISLSGKDAPKEWFSEGKKKGVGGKVKRDGPRWVIESFLLESPGKVAQHTKDTEDEAVALLYELTGKKPESRAVGEPSLDRFCSRLKEWYHGTGAHADLAEERAARPSVLVSTTHASALTEFYPEFEKKMRHLADLRTRTANPENFLRTGKSLLSYGRLSKYAPFYVTPVIHWPTVIEVERFIINHRDDTQGESES